MLDTSSVFQKYESLRPRLPDFKCSNATIEIKSILEIASKVDVFVFDAFGVLNIGEKLIPGADLALKTLRDMNKQVRVLTNAASYDKSGTEKKFLDLGLYFAGEEIITSRDAALENVTPGLWGVITAEADNLNDLKAEYIRLADTKSDFDKVDGFLFLSTSCWNSKKQLVLQDSISKNERPVIVANADLVAPRENGFTLEPGFYGHELMDLGSSNVQFFGKPYPAVYKLLTKSLSGTPGDKIAMCGDSLHTDILGAAALGWKTVLVTKDGLFSGFDTKSYCEESGIFPNWRLERLI
jgi:HAD superfamily hydrolase (TIGR01450 family)